MIERKKRDAHHHGNLKEAVIAFALDAAQNGTIETMSLREVSRRLGVSPGAVYRHFSDKDALLETLAQCGFDRLAGMFEDAVPYKSKALDAADAKRRFEALALAYVAFSRENFGLWRLMFGPYGRSTNAAPEERPSTYAWLDKSLKELQAQGVIRAFSPQKQFFAWSALHGLSDLSASPAAGEISITDATRHQCALILKALS